MSGARGISDLDPETAAAARAAVTPQIGVGGHELIRVLGEGAAGTVWLAREREAPRREVALKILKPGLEGGEAGLRFEAEMGALAMMDHPGIARVFHSGHTSAGSPFFTMELVEGATLTEFCEGRALELRSRLELFRQVCEAVAHAHQRGIIHRDLKPSNVLVTKDGAAKVIDFGIAKATETLLTHDTLLTRANQFLGTPAYMSPEQAEMRAEAIDTRSDIYSLGVLLYELVTGGTPFDPQELAALPYDEALRKVRSESPPRPSARMPAGARSSADLDWIVMKALEKEPGRRYETAGAFGRDIGRYLAGGAIKARPPSTTYLMSKFVRRHWRSLAVASTVAAALVVATAVSLVMSVKAKRSESEVRREFSRADFRVGRQEASSGRSANAVAYFARALRTDPQNEAASYRLLTTLSGESFAQLAIPPLEHGAFVRSVAWHPDGSKLFTGGIDGALRVWDAATGSLVETLYQEEHSIEHLAISPDGGSLVLSCGGGGTRVWSIFADGLIPGKPRFRVTGQRAWISADGARLATVYGDRAMVFDLASGKGRGSPMVHGRRVADLAISADGARIATCGDGGATRLWSGESGEAQADLKGPAGHRAVAAEFSPDGGTLAACYASGDGGAVILWDVESGEAKSGPLWHSSPLICLAISPDGSRLATGAEDGAAQLWLLEEGTPLARTEGKGGALFGVAFSRDGTRLVTAGEAPYIGDAAARVWDAWTGEPLSPPIHHPEGAHCFALDVGGERLATGSRDQSLRIWDIRYRAQVALELEGTHPVLKTAFSQDGKFVFGYGMDEIAMRWEAETGQLVGLPQGRGEIAAAMAASIGSLNSAASISPPVLQALTHIRELGDPAVVESTPDGLLLLVGGKDGTLRAWSWRDGSSPFEGLSHPSPITAIAADASSRRILVGCEGGSLHLWDVTTGKLLQSADTGAGEARAAITCAAFAGRSAVAIGRRDGAVSMWDLSGAAPTFAGAHSAAVVKIAVAERAEIVATGSLDNTARIWSVDEGAPLTDPLPHVGDTGPSGILLAFTPDATRLVTAGSYDDTARVWEVRTGEPALPPFEHGSAVRALAIDESGRLLATATDTDAYVWSLDSGEVLTPRMRHGGLVDSVSFDKAGQRLVTACSGAPGRIWELPELAPGGIPVWTADLAEAYVGMRLTEEGFFESVNATGLGAFGGKNDNGERVDPFAAWLAADPDKRTISPLSQIGRGQFVEKLLDRGGEASLRQALRLAPSDPRVMARLGELLVRGNNPPSRHVREADHLSALAEKLAPGDLAIAQRRAAVLGVAGRHQEALGRNFRFLKQDPVRPEAWLARGRLRRLEGSIYSAYAAFTEAARLARARRDGPLEREAEGARGEIVPRPANTLVDDYLRLQIMMAQPLPNEGEDSAEADVEGQLSKPAAEKLRLLTVAERDLDAAIDLLRAELDKEPLNPAWWVMLGDFVEQKADVALADGDRDGARASYEGALVSLYGIVAPGTRLERIRRKLEGLGSPIADDPEDAAAGVDLDRALGELRLAEVPEIALRGAVAYRKRELKLCLQLIERAIELRPENHRFALTHAGCLYMTSDPIKAMKAVRELNRAISLAEAAGDQAAWTAYMSGRQGLWQILAESDSRLVKLLGGASGARRKAQRDLLLMKGIPERDRDMAPELIDLGGVYNASLDESWHSGEPGPHNSFRNLPRGIQDFGGEVAFEIRGLVQIARAGWERHPFYKPSLRIPLGRACRKLHLLHAYGWLAKSGTVVGHYVIHYQGGRKGPEPVVVPIVVGADIGPWQIQPAEAQTATLEHPRPYWSGAHATNARYNLALYHMAWENPSPEHPIDHIEFRSTMTSAAPFLAGLTAESD